MEHKKIDYSDDELHHLLKNTLPFPPVSPWFTRKVLNRLPEKNKAIAGKIELAACIIGLIFTIIYGVLFVVRTYNSSVITYGDMLTYAIYLTLGITLTYNIITPFLLRKPYKN